MTVRFERTEESMVDCTMELLALTPAGQAIRKRFILCMAALFAALGALLVALLELLLTSRVTGQPLQAALAFGIFGYFWVDLQYRRYVRAHVRKLRRAEATRDLFGPREIALEAGGVRTKGATIEILRHWPAVNGILETPGFIVFEFADGTVEVPRSAFPTPDAASAFAQQACRLRAGTAEAQAVATANPGNGSWYHSKESAEAAQNLRLS